MLRSFVKGAPLSRLAQRPALCQCPSVHTALPRSFSLLRHRVGPVGCLFLPSTSIITQQVAYFGKGRRPLRDMSISPGTELRQPDIINRLIPADEVLLINSSGERVGIVSKAEAIEQARSEGLDLVPVSLKADPVVAKILDFKKTRLEQKQKERELKKKAPNVQIKEIKIRPDIGEHDLDVKIRKIEQFLDKKHIVNVTLQWKKSQRGRIDQGVELLELIAGELADKSVWNNEKKKTPHRVEIQLRPTPKSAAEKEAENLEKKGRGPKEGSDKSDGKHAEVKEAVQELLDLKTAFKEQTGAEYKAEHPPSDEHMKMWEGVKAQGDYVRQLKQTDN